MVNNNNYCVKNKSYVIVVTFQRGYSNIDHSISNFGPRFLKIIQRTVGKKSINRVFYV